MQFWMNEGSCLFILRYVAHDNAGISLGMCPANERYHYTVMTSVIGLAHTIARTHWCVRNDSETQETVLLDCTTGEAGNAIQ